LVLKVFLTRHGPKASASGEKDDLAEFFDSSVNNSYQKMGLESGKGLVHIASSTLPRAIKSAEIINQNLRNSSHRTGRGFKNFEQLEAPTLSTSYKSDQTENFSSDLDRIKELQSNLEDKIRQAVKNEHPNLSAEETEIEVRNRIDMEVMKKFFSDEEQPSDKRFFRTSYHELADGLAQRYLGFGRRIGNLDNMRQHGKQQPIDEPYVEIDVSHSFPITAFLKKYLILDDGQAAMSMNPDDFFNRVGGIIRESNTIEIDYWLVGDQVKLEIKGEFEPGKKFSGTINLNKSNEKAN